MQAIQLVAQRVQNYQNTLNSKGYGHLGMGVAAALMLWVCCPMSFVSVAAPYWQVSQEMGSASISSQASLWKVSTSTEFNGNKKETSVDMCGEEMSNSEECGKIHAVRFFTIASLLLSLASGVTLAVGFLPKFRPVGTISADLRRKLSLCGVSIAAAVLLFDLLGMCIAATVEVGSSKLNGAGFVFLVMELLFVGVATALVVCTLTRWSARVVTMEAAAVGSGTPVVKVGKSREEAESSPTLMSSPHMGAQKPKANDSSAPIAEEKGENVEIPPANGATVVVAS